MEQLFWLYFWLPTYIVGLIAIIIFLYKVQDDIDWLDFGAIFGTMVIWGVLTAMASGIVFLASKNHVQKNFETYETVYLTRELRSLDANEDINGRMGMAFFVGSGYINEDLYYHFFYDTEHGIRYQKERAAQKNFYLKEINGKPTYKRYGTFYKKEHKNSIFYEPYVVERTKDVLEIPKGTVKTHYKVN